MLPACLRAWFGRFFRGRNVLTHVDQKVWAIAGRRRAIYRPFTRPFTRQKFETSHRKNPRAREPSRDVVGIQATPWPCTAPAAEAETA